MKIKNLKKGNKGITLIALVITIIVLLILAGVTIATLTGENGLLNRATNAKEVTTKAQYEEELNIAITDIKVGAIIDLKNKQLTKKAIIDELPSKVTNLEWQNTEIDNPEGVYKDYNFYIDSDFVAHIEEKSDIKVSIKILTEGFVSPGETVEVEVSATSTEGEVQLTHESNESISVSEEISSSNKKYSISKNGTYTFSVTDGKTTKTRQIKIDSFLETPEIEVTNNDTGVSFTVNVKNEYSSDIKFRYYLNEQKQHESESRTYDMNNLSLNTSYTVKVSLIYNGTEVATSNSVTVTTPTKPSLAKMVLYKSNGTKIDEYQTLTTTGIKERTVIEAEEDVILEVKSSNASIFDCYYSLDAGVTWNLYTDKISLKYPGDGQIQTKQVHKTNNLESNINIYRIIDAWNGTVTELDSSLYDGDATTGKNGVSAYLYVDKEMIGKSVYFKNYATSGGYCYGGITKVDTTGEITVIVEAQNADGNWVIPEGTEKIYVYSQYYNVICEIQPVIE